MEVVRVDVIFIIAAVLCPIHQKPPNLPVMSGHNSSGKRPVKSGRRCTLLAWNISISLAGSEEQVNFSQQSPQMLKMASERFIHALSCCCCC